MPPPAAISLNFHWRTLCLPPRTVEYVVIHELVHLVEPYHGKDFWRRVERIIPDFADRKRWVAENGDATKRANKRTRRGGSARSYFVRHTDRLSIQTKDLEELWEQDRIVIHLRFRPGACSFRLHIGLRKWAMLVSNQRPLPCESGACSFANFRVCVLSACVSRMRRVRRRGCSRLLAPVVVKTVVRTRA